MGPLILVITGSSLGKVERSRNYSLAMLPIAGRFHLSATNAGSHRVRKFCGLVLYDAIRALAMTPGACVGVVHGRTRGSLFPHLFFLLDRMRVNFVPKRSRDSRALPMPQACSAESRCRGAFSSEKLPGSFKSRCSCR